MTIRNGKNPDSPDQGQVPVRHNQDVEHVPGNAGEREGIPGITKPDMADPNTPPKPEKAPNPIESKGDDKAEVDDGPDE